MSTTRAYACIALTPQEVERWPDTPVANVLAVAGSDRVPPPCTSRQWTEPSLFADT